MGPFLVPFRALEDAEAFDALEAGIFAGALAAASLAAELRSLPRGAVLGTVRAPTAWWLSARPVHVQGRCRRCQKGGEERDGRG